MRAARQAAGEQGRWRGVPGAGGFATDPATLKRVATALRGQLGGALPVLPDGGTAGGRAPVLEHRTFTPLWHVRADGWPL